MDTRIPRLAAALSLLTAAGCGTTHVYTNHASAKIYVDGAFVGEGRGQVDQRGFPATAEVVVKTPEGSVARAEMKRSFSLATFLIGCLVCPAWFVAGWEYPNAFYLPVDTGARADWNDGRDPPAEAGARSGWENARDPWLEPPKQFAPAQPPPPPKPVTPIE